MAIVSRKFWPMCGPSEQNALNLAVALRDLGHHVSIVTARWEKKWPRHFQIQQIEVDRIPRPGQGPWGSFRYQRQLARTLTEKTPLDGIVVFGLTEENLTKIRALRGIPIILRLDYRQFPYPKWSLLKNRKQRAVFEHVRQVMVDSVFSANQLAAFGIPLDKIHVIGDAVVPDDEQRSTALQVQSRIAISNAHPVLSIDPNQPLVLAGAPFDEDGGANDLIDAWSQVVKAFPKARLWLLGDGPRGKKLWSKICSMNLVYSVILPGYFDELRPIFDAADLYVHPLRTGRACHVLTQAMNARLASVATETTFTASLIEKNKTGIVVPPGNPKAMTEAILHALKNQDLCRRLGNAARDRVVKSHSQSNIVHRFLENLVTGQLSASQTIS